MASHFGLHFIQNCAKGRFTIVNNVDEANDLSRIASCRPRLQVDPSTPPALQPELSKFLISTLINRLNTHEIRVAHCEFEVKSLDSAKCMQVVAAETPTQNSIKDALFPPKRKAGLSSSHSGPRSLGVSFAGKICVTKYSSQDGLRVIKCASRDGLRVIKCASQGDAAKPRKTRRRPLRYQVLRRRVLRQQVLSCSDEPAIVRVSSLIANEPCVV
jgi:hypothetical protein